MKIENIDELKLYEKFCTEISIEAKAHLAGFTDERIIRCLQAHPEIINDSKHTKLIELFKRVDTHCTHGTGFTMKWDIEYTALYYIYTQHGIDIAKAFVDMQSATVPERLAGPRDPESIIRMLYCAMRFLSGTDAITIEPDDIKEPNKIIGLIHYTYRNQPVNPVDYLWTDFKLSPEKG